MFTLTANTNLKIYFKFNFPKMMFFFWIMPILWQMCDMQYYLVSKEYSISLNPQQHKNVYIKIAVVTNKHHFNIIQNKNKRILM